LDKKSKRVKESARKSSDLVWILLSSIINIRQEFSFNATIIDNFADYKSLDPMNFKAFEEKQITFLQAVFVFSLFITGCFLIISCSNENVKNSLSEQNLNGKVKSMTVTTFPVDESGKIIDSNFLEKTSYRYDSQGNKIEEIHYYPDSVSDLITFKYDLNGKKVEKRWLDSNDELDHLATFTYDKKGHKIEKRWSETNGNLMKKATYSYDKHGNKTTEEIISIEDSMSERRTFIFDNRHNLIEETQYNSDDSITHWYSYKYLEFDQAGNWLKRLQSEKNIPITLTIRVIEYSL
jgi:hypothetical protein